MYYRQMITDLEFYALYPLEHCSSKHHTITAVRTLLVQLHVYNKYKCRIDIMFLVELTWRGTSVINYESSIVNFICSDNLLFTFSHDPRSTVEPRFKQLFGHPKKVAYMEVLLISGFCIYYINAKIYGSFFLKTHLSHAIFMFPNVHPKSVTPKPEKTASSWQNSRVLCMSWSQYIPEQNVPLKAIYFTPLLYR